MARRILAGLTLVIAGLGMVPGEALAADPDCTEDYALCLNSALQKSGIFRELASVECAVEWFGCVADKA